MYLVKSIQVRCSMEIAELPRRTASISSRWISVANVRHENVDMVYATNRAKVCVSFWIHVKLVCKYDNHLQSQ